MIALGTSLSTAKAFIQADVCLVTRTLCSRQLVKISSVLKQVLRVKRLLRICFYLLSAGSVNSVSAFCVAKPM